jgi:predicted TPR repeat methyltransferase
VRRLGLPPEEHERALEYRLAAARLSSAPARAPAEYVARAFDGYAERYEDHMQGTLGYHGPEVLFAAVARLVGPAGGSLDVLDLGCGTGLAAPLFRPLARRLDGVDLSKGMLEKARDRQLYDALEVADIAESLRARPGAYDLLLALEVLNYVGDLAPVMAAAAAALRPGGLFALTAEKGEGAGFALRGTGRYTHSLGYVLGEAVAAGLEELHAEEAALRSQQGKPMVAHVVVLRRPGAT